MRSCKVLQILFIFMTYIKRGPLKWYLPLVIILIRWILFFLTMLSAVGGELKKLAYFPLINDNFNGIIAFNN